MTTRAACALACALLATCPISAQGAPQVIQLEPADGATEVDASEVNTLVIRFDQPMSQRGHSICGGGPQFPEFVGRPKWRDQTTMILTVALEPGHTYRMSLNCPAAQNFRSAKGKPLVTTPWSFSTLPDAKNLLSIKKQRRLNQKSFKALQRTLAAEYSYYEHKQLDWDQLFAKHRDAILQARTTRGWAVAVGRLLEPANDIHMVLRVDGDTIATGRRRIDSLYRGQLLGKHIKGLSESPQGVLTGRTEDGIGYLMISGWTDSIDFTKVEELIVAMKDAKALIIDVRPNSGGSENLAMQVAQWFIDGTKTYAKHATRRGKGAKNFYPVSKRKIKGKPRSKRFGKPVAVLMSRYCMSSCEAFLLMMKQAELCTLIGQRSYGSSGNPKSHDLPNGVQIVLPSWKVMRLDESCFEDQGIAPDIEVPATSEDFVDRDPILEKALSQLRRK